MLVSRLLLSLSALPLTCVVAFIVPQSAVTHDDGPTRTSLNAIKKDPTATSRRAALASLVSFSLAPFPLTLASQVASASIQSNLDSTGVLLSKGAYQAEAGFDDFSGGLTMPKYTLDDNSLKSILESKDMDPAKLEKMQANAAAAGAKVKAKVEAEAAKKEARAAAATAQLEANAAKIKAKEEAKARQIAQMSPEQRAKIEAYNESKNDGKQQPNGLGNMKRMYGL